MTRVIEVTMRVLLNTQEEADELLNGLSELEEENLFPTCADIRSNWIELNK